MMAPGGHRGRRGFTLVELLLAMIAGIVVLGASTSLVLGSMRGMRGTELRDGIERRARFTGIALQRDVQLTGVAIDSRPTFGTIGTFADTLVMLRAPFLSPVPGDPEEPAISYARTALLPLASGVGNCGAFCLEVTRQAGETFQINPGQLAYVELNSNVRRLIRVTAVAFPGATRARITFANTARILGHSAGVVGVDLRKPFTVRTLRAVAFYRNAQNQLLRADSTDNAGNAVPQVIATGVQSWDAALVFLNGVEADVADPDTDGDPDNNYDDIARVHVWATLAADRADPRVNNGVVLTRRVDWWLTPRNLVYERNRL
ncbi:MAG TPA: prepilin-type N-terminal cleavage/methylation domain-containing protein [Gemmatimonadales bacterium]|jgi:hypothetical protein